MQATRNQYSTPQHHYRNATTAAAAAAAVATSANAATIRRRTLSHVSRSYSLGTSAASAAASAAATAATAAATPATSSASNNQLSIHKTGIMVAASRCRSPIMLCHSHSDGEFPLYRGKFDIDGLHNLLNRSMAVWEDKEALPRSEKKICNDFWHSPACAYV
ncbi:uncharacterized protein LOC108107717 [Drosophila eugracilis]|uniref:uncharacterized protein LOC108107717 n=1 Tax=Drosophila eugracilis TaxID=29029 RepID=UPI0007E71895|nr:uncharacterized protein LOC108107717 [Drosophila eugracilis]